MVHGSIDSPYLSGRAAKKRAMLEGLFYASALKSVLYSFGAGAVILLLADVQYNFFPSCSCVRSCPAPHLRPFHSVANPG